MDNKEFCKYCGEKIDAGLVVCPKCGRQLKMVKKSEKKEEIKETKKEKEEIKFYTQSWFMWLMLIFFAPVGILFMWKFNDKITKKNKIIISIIFGLIFLLLIIPSESKSNDESNNTNNSNNSKQIEVIDFSTMNIADILTWCKDNNLDCNIKRSYSDYVEKDQFIMQSVKKSEKVSENTKITITFSLGKEPSIEYKNALIKAKSYAKTLHMSKSAIYNQLISEYGEGFTEDAAKYAIDNIIWDWSENALKKAKTYRDTMNMSKNAIYDQLISEYGEKFTKEEAQYAIDHLDD